MKKKHGNTKNVKKTIKVQPKESTLKIWMWAGWVIAAISTLTLILFFVFDVGGNGANNDEHLWGSIGDPLDDFDFTDFQPPPPIILDNTTVATVNGMSIGADDVGFRIQEAQWTLDSDFAMFSDEWERAVREEAVRLAAINMLIEDYAAQHGITLPEDEIFMLNNEIDQMEWQMGIEDFDAALRGDAIQGREHLQRIFHSFSLTEAVMNAIIADPAQFARFEAYMPADNFAVAEAKANEILARALDGEDFDELMFAYSEDPGLWSFLDGYTFTVGEMLASFEQATRELEIGEISGLVRTRHGFHIIKRIEPNPDEIWNEDDEWFGAKHILIEAEERSIEGKQREAIYAGFEAMAEIEFLTALNDIPVW